MCIRDRSATPCKNKPMGALMKKLAACVGVWSHSAVNDKLKDIQRQLEEDFHEIYELLRRNDTWCDCIYLYILILFWERCKCFRSFGLNSSMERVLLQIDLFLLDMTFCALYQFRLFIVGLKLCLRLRVPFSFPCVSWVSSSTNINSEKLGN